MIGKKESGLIRPPGRRLLRFLPLRFANKQNHGGKRSGYADLNLTSMVDMLTILVVFLLQTFSSTGELFLVSKNITLPTSSQYRELVQAPLITISAEEATLTLGQEQVSVNKHELESTNYNHYKLEPFYTPLTQERRRFTDVSKFEGIIFFQADKGVDFGLIKRVLYTCTQAGYSTIKPLVLPPAGQ